MSFEVLHSDLLARIGRLRTKSAVVETPLFLPVINPNIPSPSPRQMYEDFGAVAVIANAYILRKHFAEKISESGIHSFLDFPGVVMTDSGAYQILRYGSVEADPLEIVKFQEDISTDIAVILDVPTGWDTVLSRARETVDVTLARARKALEVRERRDILWVGPVQGGRHLDLVSWSAEQTGKLPFDLHALGSPTEVMEQYFFQTLVEMICAAKSRLPASRPLHLFGAGHPMVLPFAVALGCDLFDSAAYSIYARSDRYLTHGSTLRLEDMGYLPCSCLVCARMNPRELMNLPRAERQNLLAEHNLHITFSELREIKQAILQGRLWELLEQRARAHPALMRALHAIESHRDALEKGTPRFKTHGLLFTDVTSLSRPEVARHHKRLTERYRKPAAAKVLLLLPNPQLTPFHSSRLFRDVRGVVKRLDKRSRSVHICFYGLPFGLTPVEIDDCYPLSQFESAIGVSKRLSDHLCALLRDFLKVHSYPKVVLGWDPTLLAGEDVKSIARKFRLKVAKFDCDPCSEKTLRILEKALRVCLRSC